MPRAAPAQDMDQILLQQQVQQQVMMQQLAQQQAQLQLQQSIDLQQQQLQMQQMASAQQTVPEHLQIGSQRFDASVAGLREYLEATKATDPKLYDQLAPDVARLESGERRAQAALSVGVVLGLASMVYGFASQDDCRQPTLADRNFAADTAAWGACNDANNTRMTMFGLLGAGVVVVGGAIALANWPSRSDLLDLVRKHNRLSRQPLQLRVGYDPTQRLAYSGAAVAF